MLLSELSCDLEATGSSSHGGDVGSHVLITHGFAPAATLLLPPVLQQQQQPLEEQPKAKKKRSQPGNPDPEAEVIALSPRTLVATNRFVCEVCNKGFQRDQNLQLHRRGHNLPWKLRQRATPPPSANAKAGVDPSPSPSPAARKRVYVCPEPSCVHHDPARALGDLTGIKKHYSRKHGEKRWRCERCGKRYAVHSDWKAHVKNCGTREYRCDCGILFSRKDSLLTHRAFCDALAEESARLLAAANNSSSSITTTTTCNNSSSLLISSSSSSPLFLPFSSPPPAPNPNPNPLLFDLTSQEAEHHLLPPFQASPYLDHLTGSDSIAGDVADTVSFGLASEGSVTLHAGGHRRLTRDFLGIDDAGEVEELPLPLPLCAAAATATAVSRAACCATDLTKQLQYHGGRLPPVNETWSHNF